METTLQKPVSKPFLQDKDSPIYQVLQLLRRCIRATDRHSKALQNRYGLTTPQQLCLLNLGQEDSLSVSDLAKRVHLSPSTVVGIVDRLEKRGLLRRIRQSNDRRIVSVQMTEQGKALVDSAPPPIQEKLIEGLDILPQETQNTIVHSLETIVHLMGIEEQDASPILMPNVNALQHPGEKLYADTLAITTKEQKHSNVGYRGFNIRPAEWEDMETIAGFIRSTAEWYRPFADEKDMAEHEVDDEWKKINFERREFFISHNNHEPIGTISMQQFENYAYLGYIYLDKKHVGKRYGQILMNFTEQLARERRLKGMVLISHPEATWAVRAYEKFGFKTLLTDKSAILEWEDGVLKPYYEEGFHLFHYTF